MRELPDARGDEGASPVTHGVSNAPCHPGGWPAKRGPRPGHAPALRPAVELEGVLPGRAHRALKAIEPLRRLRAPREGVLEEGRRPKPAPPTEGNT
eukprot:3638560-Alexandrium_andersonii.AAC.1